MNKAEVYARLIEAGVENGFRVVPEYRIKPSLESKKREADVAWCIENPATNDGRPWLPAAVFEIEGHDVERGRQGETELRGVEKDADAILSAAWFAFESSKKNSCPAAAVVLFRLDENGEEHNRRFNRTYFEDTRTLFRDAIGRLRDKHAGKLPACVAQANWPLVLDDDLTDEQLRTFVDAANAFRNAIARPVA